MPIISLLEFQFQLQLFTHGLSLCCRFFLLFSLLLSLIRQSSTIGVTYISRLLEIQDRERAPPSVQIAAAYGVLHRLLPSHSSSFEFGIVSKEQCGGDSCFMISNHPSSSGHGAPEILITGVTGVEIMAGLHWYLKYWCGSHISWDKTGGAQLLSVPDSGSFPHVQEAGILIQRPIPWNYYQNAVTSSWQEAIWQKVFRNFNISHLDLKDFFGGPAFLSWSRMGNLHGWGGPLPQSWLDQQLLLQKKILARMYELGMTPVLPAFSGNVPAALKYIFPSAKITRLGNW
ncbi:Alpha-N-acetylglucosaminidase [Vitis vinifera]|uniref:Alpha-N-acetylglucosaminidase n=1 Tax=Vitis vinifera TaxID=29760 RepID=A0A438KBH6_VITVI|nr:Alpha-N-acetylglucosaminidase [Vitis vinifera]